MGPEGSPKESKDYLHSPCVTRCPDCKCKMVLSLAMASRLWVDPASARPGSPCSCSSGLARLTLRFLTFASVS